MSTGMPKYFHYSFGATSAVVTSLAIIIGLSSAPGAKIAIITTLLILAIADNVSDSFGIHIHQESQMASIKEVRRATILNYLTRLVISGVFILSVLLLPIKFAVIFSIIFGVFIITALSYLISKEKKTNPIRAILQHLAIALVVMVGSYFLRDLVTSLAVQFH